MTVDDLDISAECAAELKRLARLRQRDDPYGIALAEQVVDFLRDYRNRDIREKVQAWNVAAKSFRVLTVASEYPHGIFLEAIEGALDEVARRARRELVRRMLLGILTETEAAEALRLLNLEAERHGIDVSREIDEVEAELTEAALCA